jgi:hypothetical protein
MTNGRIGPTAATREPTRTGDPAIAGTHAQPSIGGAKGRSLTYLFRGLLVLALLVPVSLITISPALAGTTIAATTTCGNALGDLGGRGLICEVTIVNSITTAGGTSTVTVRECLGSAGSPTDGSGGGGFPCSTVTSVLTQPVTAVTQCNDSINGGGGTLRCSVKVTNNFIGVSPGSTAASVNQCVGSGASGIVGQTINCDPFPATTTSAAITQCNGTANGGTLVGLTCTATGTMASALPVTILQCQGSANGGGALVICSANVVNAVGPAASSSASASSTPSASSSASSSRTPSTTSTGSGSSNGGSTPILALLICLVLGGIGVALIESQRRRLRS